MHKLLGKLYIEDMKKIFSFDYQSVEKTDFKRFLLRDGQLVS